MRKSVHCDLQADHKPHPAEPETSGSGYIAVGRMTECGSCHPEKYMELGENVCDCVCHDEPQRDGETVKHPPYRCGAWCTATESEMDAAKTQPPSASIESRIDQAAEEIIEKMGGRFLRERQHIAQNRTELSAILRRIFVEEKKS